MTIAANDEGNLTKSFQGLRVLDFSTTIAGPHCARMLADMGAEVIKIESAEGETMRTRPPLRNNFSTVFGQLNVGKKSLVLDLKSPDAIEVIRRLVAGTDIVDFNVPFLNGTLSSSEYDGMTSLCNFIQANGTGFGICKSCRLGALGGAKQ